MKALTKIIVRQVLFGDSDVVENENRVNKIWGPPASNHLTKQKSAAFEYLCFFLSVSSYANDTGFEVYTLIHCIYDFMSSILKKLKNGRRALCSTFNQRGILSSSEKNAKTPQEKPSPVQTFNVKYCLNMWF